jgi:S1-C subfamily serine protease
VTAIDGKPIGRIDPDLLDRQLEDGAPGSKIALTLARDGKEKTLTVKLRDIL